MKHSFARKCMGLFLAATIVALGFSPQCRSVYRIPQHLYLMEGEQNVVSIPFPFEVRVIRDPDRMLAVNDHGVTLAGSFLGDLQSHHKAQMQLRLLNVLPIRVVDVDVLPSVKLFPGGQSIGIVLHSQGVMVVGYSPIVGQDGTHHLPAKDAHIAVGDVILSVNGQPIQDDNHMAELIHQIAVEGQALECEVKRGADIFSTTIAPVLCAETHRYRIGLFIRDGAAGVGTLSFYDPDTKKYGALGHVITDNDTNVPIDVRNGHIVLASVSGIQSGKRGQPGEKIGVFFEEDAKLGIIQKNTSYGIYGQLYGPLQHSLYDAPIPVASMSQVKVGPAEILTVVEGQTIDKYTVEIVKVNLQEQPEGKGLVIKVTDPRLLEKTGGIVQGMSGSPIIQDEKLVGVITHVFVHDPTRGYGLFIEWMLRENSLSDNMTTTKRMFTLSGLLQTH